MREDREARQRAPDREHAGLGACCSLSNEPFPNSRGAPHPADRWPRSLAAVERRKRIRFVRNLALREVGRAQNPPAEFHELSTRDHKLHRAFRRSAGKGMRRCFCAGAKSGKRCNTAL